ncbi:MAG: AAA family ATPase [Fretibacterium sp.]|nr:AAA family ATPase [Fretibacterium sp.]
MNEKLSALPIGIQTFEKLRAGGCLYVDKTARLQELIAGGTSYFLSRPRRFGKSLTLSTLDAMFSGKAELFKGLAAEAWVAEQAKHPAPVLRLDMSSLQEYSSAESLDKAIRTRLHEVVSDRGLGSVEGDRCGEIFRQVIRALFKAVGPVVVLIDEYDKPILDNIGDLEGADAMRRVLRSFYTVLKSCDEYLRFVMLTGISKFSKAGVFSAMNNLNDISMDRHCGDIVGYTQTELEENFAGWIEVTAESLSLDKKGLLEKIKDYYDGFSFDGRAQLYNPFSILNFFAKQEFRNYWYTSGSPSFIADYMKRHGIQDPEEYHDVVVELDFADSQEIERANPVSFLYQAGYLTVRRQEEEQYILDYPNREVRNSISRMYLEHVYHVPGYVPLGSDIWRSLKVGDMARVVELYNAALSGIPYEDYTGQGESWYRSLFLMLLRGAGVTANGEVHSNRGRSDVQVSFPGQAIILEFKYARTSGALDNRRAEGERQIEEKNYARPYDAEGRRVTGAVIVIDGEKRAAVL